MKGTRRVGAHNVQPVCGHRECAHCGRVVRGENFFLKKNVLRALQTLPPPSPPKGFETYMYSFFTTCMVRLSWGAIGNSGRELTRGFYALKHKYHLPCSPPVAIFFANIHTAKMFSASF